MGFESLSKKSGLKEAALGASALMSAGALEAESFPDDYSIRSYQIENISTVQQSETFIPQKETDSVESTPNEEGLDEDNEDNEEDYEEDEEEFSLESIPTPPSFIEELTPEQLQVFQAGIERYQAYAREDSVERAGIFMINEDGSVEWIDRQTAGMASQANLQVVEMQEMEIPEGVIKLLIVHSHPTKHFEGSNAASEAVDIPPSFIDMRGSLEGQIGTDNSVMQENMVVTEAGMWRYGPKSPLVVEQYRALLEIGTEDLEGLEDEKMQLQAEIFMQKMTEYMLDNGYPREQLEHYNEKIKDISVLKGALQSEPSLVVGLTAFVKELESQPDYSELGVKDFSNLITSLYQKKQEYLANKNPNADLDTYVNVPTSFSNNAKEEELADRSKQWSSYIDKWEALGMYIEPVK